MTPAIDARPDWNGRRHWVEVDAARLEELLDAALALGRAIRAGERGEG